MTTGIFTVLSCSNIFLSLTTTSPLTTKLSHMRKLTITVAIILLLATAAVGIRTYSKNQHEIQEAVLRMKKEITIDFHDPESARFRDIRLYSLNGSINERFTSLDLKSLKSFDLNTLSYIFSYDPQAFQLCGEVNAKNGFGAYVGYKKFNVLNGNDPIVLLDTKGELNAFFESVCGNKQSEGLIYSEPK